MPAPLLTQAFMRSAQRFGAVLMPAQARGLERQGDRVVGVRHRHGVIACDNVVLAMGASAHVASEWLGTPVPVTPLRGERLMLLWPFAPLQVLLTTPRRGHLISRLDGFLSIGSTGGRDFDDRSNWVVDRGDAAANPHPTPSIEAREELLTRATEVLPDIKLATVAEQIAGIRPFSPDSHPIVGAASGWDGVFWRPAIPTAASISRPSPGKWSAISCFTGARSRRPATWRCSTLSASPSVWPDRCPPRRRK